MSLPPPPDLTFEASAGTGNPDGGTASGRKTDAPATRTLTCRTVARGGFIQRNTIRDLPVTDEPIPQAVGEAGAPNALEALLAAFGSCLALGIQANAAARGVPIRSLELDLEADADATGGWGAGSLQPRPIGLETIRVLVRMEADAPRKSLEALIRHALLWSPAANTLHNPVHLDVNLAPG